MDQIYLTFFLFSQLLKQRTKRKPAIKKRQCRQKRVKQSVKSRFANERKKKDKIQLVFTNQNYFNK